MVICCLLMPQSLDSDVSDRESVSSQRSNRSPQKQKSPSKKGKGRGKGKQGDDSLESMMGSIIEYNKEQDKKVGNLSFHGICTPLLKPTLNLLLIIFLPFYSPDAEQSRAEDRGSRRGKDLLRPAVCRQGTQDT